MCCAVIERDAEGLYVSEEARRQYRGGSGRERSAGEVCVRDGLFEMKRSKRERALLATSYHLVQLASFGNSLLYCCELREESQRRFLKRD